jgi:hypothetical protein
LTTGKGANGKLLAFLIETDRCKNLNHLLLSGKNALIGQDRWEDRGIFIGAIDLRVVTVLNVECANPGLC